MDGQLWPAGVSVAVNASSPRALKSISHGTPKPRLQSRFRAPSCFAARASDLMRFASPGRDAPPGHPILGHAPIGLVKNRFSDNRRFDPKLHFAGFFLSLLLASARRSVFFRRDARFLTLSLPWLFPIRSIHSPFRRRFQALSPTLSNGVTISTPSGTPICRRLEKRFDFPLKRKDEGNLVYIIAGKSTTAQRPVPAPPFP